MKQPLHPNEDARKVIQEIHGKRSIKSHSHSIINFFETFWKETLIGTLICIGIVVVIPIISEQLVKKNIQINIPGNTGESRIIGKWENVDNSDNFEFFEEGTFGYSTTAPIIHGNYAGNYKFLNIDHIRIDIIGVPLIGTKTEVYKIIFSGNTFTLTEQNGNILIYRRVKI
jgi:hypothetical protein